MLGVIFKIRAASTNWGALSPLPGNCICTPCFICAGWLSRENNFGFEIVLLIPSVSNASNWIFNTAEPVLLKTPIPLVAAPTAPDWNKPSFPEPIAAVPDDTAKQNFTLNFFVIKFSNSLIWKFFLFFSNPWAKKTPPSSINFDNFFF